MSRLIPDSECVQSKCARNTTGCWGECEMRRSPAMYGMPTPGVYTVSAASPVQGAASFAPGWNISCTVTDGAASSASGAKGAAVKPWAERMGVKVGDQVSPAAAFPYMKEELLEWRALADRSPAVQPVTTEQALRKLCDSLEGMKRTMFLMPGTGQHYSYLLWEDASFYVEEARESIATPAPEQEAAPLDLAALIDECREAVTYWEPLRPFIEQFDAKLEQEAAPKCPRCKDTGTWTCTEEPGDYGDEYPCMDCDAQEAAPVAPPGAQDAVPVGEIVQKDGFWDFHPFIAWPEIGEVKLYTAPVPATTPAEQPEGAQAERECTCPSGNGSLAWPCPQHPPEGADVMRRFGAPASQHSAPAGALHDALMRCCLELPAGYEVRVCVERDSGWVEFADANGDTRHIEGEGHLSDDVVEALEAVQAEASASPVPRAQGGITNDNSSGEGCATATNTNQPENLGAANTNKGGEGEN